MSNWRRNPFLRKGTDLLRRTPRPMLRALSDRDDYERRRPIVANSFPKSGTHLLTQVLHGAFPERKTYGVVIASQPSLRFVVRSHDAIARRVARIVPGEFVIGHIFHGPAIANSLAQRAALHYFIIRDLRDVAVSEAMYLRDMNRWHRLHRYFRGLSPEEAIELAITGGAARGIPLEYPDIAARFAHYHGWLRAPDVCVVRFEELRGEGCTATVRRMLEFAGERGDAGGSLEERLRGAIATIAPERSHTFRAGRTGGWEEAMSAANRRSFVSVAEDLNRSLGYSPTE